MSVKSLRLMEDSGLPSHIVSAICDLVEEKEQLQATNKELLSALERAFAVMYGPAVDISDAIISLEQQMREAITNAKQVMGDKG